MRSRGDALETDYGQGTQGQTPLPLARALIWLV